jgi:hypothetical protein
VAEQQPYRYRASVLWRVYSAGVIALLVFLALRVVFAGFGSQGDWWALLLPVVLSINAVRWTYEVVIDPEQGIVTLRAPLGCWSRRRRLADLRAVELRPGAVSLVFDGHTHMVFGGRRAHELVAYLHRVRPDLPERWRPVFALVLRGYDSTEVDDYLQRLREGRAEPTVPSFSIQLRGYDRVQVDQAIARLTWPDDRDEAR